MKGLSFAYLIPLTCLFFMACEDPEDVLPEPPAGVFVYGTSAAETGTAICAKPGGGYLAAGAVMNELGDWDAKLMHFSADGDLDQETIWESDTDVEVIRSIKPSSGGGYVLGGVSLNMGSNEIRFEIVLLDASYNIVERYYFGELYQYYTSDQFVHSYIEVFEMPSGGWVAYGRHASTAQLYRITNNGSLQATRSLSTDVLGYYNFTARPLTQGADGKIYMATVINNYPSYNLVFDQLGDNLYSEVGLTINIDSLLDPDNYNQPVAASLIQTSSGAFVVDLSVTTSNQTFINFDGLTGSKNWTKEFSVTEPLNLLTEDQSGNLCFGGQTEPGYYYSPSNFTDINSIAGYVDSLGAGLRRRTFGGEKFDGLGGIAVGADGKVAYLGTTFSFGKGQGDVMLFFYP